MRLGTKGRYAVMAMTDLAAHGRDRAVTLAEVSGRQQISLAYLEQLFSQLRRAGLVKSVRGPGGGYRLGRPCDAIPIAEIVAAVDEPIHATRCEGVATGCMGGGERCATHELWDALGRRIEDFLAEVTLDDVVARRLTPERHRAPAASAERAPVAEAVW
jgi:Rrf2 family iron-sulfur cluster assembly transcriptional regulator